MKLEDALTQHVRTGLPFKRSSHDFWMCIGKEGIICDIGNMYRVSFKAITIAASDWEMMSQEEYSQMDDSAIWFNNIFAADTI